MAVFLLYMNCIDSSCRSHWHMHIPLAYMQLEFANVQVAAAGVKSVSFGLSLAEQHPGVH
eukprot:12096604-Karenia_brevis.AAC.1